MIDTARHTVGLTLVFIRLCIRDIIMNRIALDVAQLGNAIA